MVIDLSQRINAGMPVYPGDAPVELTLRRSFARDGWTAFDLKMSMHAGTHADAPMHLTDDPRFICDLPADRFFGSGVLLPGMDVPKDGGCIDENSAVLLWTGADELYGTPEYYTGHPVMTDALCDLLIARRVRLVGMDTPSPDRAPYQIHKRLLSAGIPIIENLTNLSLLSGKKFQFYAFPLSVYAEASPVRAVAVTEDAGL